MDIQTFKYELNHNPKKAFRPAIGYRSFISGFKFELILWMIIGFSIIIAYGNTPKAYIVKFIEDSMNIDKPFNIIGFVGMLLAYFGVIITDFGCKFSCFDSIAHQFSLCAKNTLIYSYRLVMIGISTGIGIIMASIIIEPKTFKNILLFLVFWPLAGALVVMSFCLWWLAYGVLDKDNRASVIIYFYKQPVTRRLLTYLLIGGTLFFCFLDFLHQLAS